MKTILMAIAAALALVTLAGTASHAQSGIHRLGHRWDVTVPGGWTGVWTRRDISGGISNIYDAAWYHPAHGSIQSELRVHIDVRDGLIIERRDLNGPQAGRTCRYTGQLFYAQGTARGTFSCQWAAGPFQWSARTWR